MYLRHHLLSCIILVLILFPFYSYYSFLIFLLGFFIDLDHYIYYVFKYKNFNLIKSYKSFMDKKMIRKDQLHILHTIEFIILFLLATIYTKNIYLIFISIGFLVHLILDLIYAVYLIKNKIELKQTRALSLIFWIKRNLFY